MTRPLNILFVGQLYTGSTSAHRMQALIDLDQHVTPLNTAPPALIARSRRLVRRLIRRVVGVQDLAGVNARILAHARKETFDVFWFEKAVEVLPSTFLELKRLHPRCVIAGYAPDDMAAKHNHSRQFLAHLPLYDVFFTTKSFGVEELTALGAQRVHFIPSSYDPHTHYPDAPDAVTKAALGGVVGFTGAWEEERSASLYKIAAAGIPVRVWGTGWERSRYSHPNMRIENRTLWGDDYRAALQSFDLNICFLRKINRDLHTSRSLELPACGCFLLAERTIEHSMLFDEGSEAEFFASDDELLAKVTYFLNHPEERNRIARNGYDRCVRSGYSTRHRVGSMLEQVQELVEGLEASVLLDPR